MRGSGLWRVGGWCAGKWGGSGCGFCRQCSVGEGDADVAGEVVLGGDAGAEVVVGVGAEVV